MKNNKCLPLAVIAALVLSACGGGGSDGGSSAPAVPQTPQDPTPLTTSAPTSTYAASSMQFAAFNQLNAYRLAMGVGALTQDPILDTSAQAHATYLNANFINSKLTALSHDELSSFANYYADTPLDRARKAGAPATEWIGETVGDSMLASDAAAGKDCVNQLYNTVYHLAGITDPQQTVGIGYMPVSGQLGFAVCNFDFGSTTGVYGTPQANAIPGYGSQQMATTAVAHVPLANETGVALTMVTETPNPAPSITTASNGSSVPGLILIPAAAQAGSIASATVDSNKLLGAGVTAFVPSQALAANTVYTASFTGARDGAPINLAWSFTTGN